MEREKMIEEMTTFLKCCNHLCNECDRAKQLSGVYGCIEFSISKTLYDAGYRKVPDGAVVLTREEYERLASYISEERAIEIFHEETEKLKEKIRKETAREILGMLQPCDICIRTNCINCVKVEIKEKYGVVVDE